MTANKVSIFIKHDVYTRSLHHCLVNCNSWSRTHKFDNRLGDILGGFLASVQNSVGVLGVSRKIDVGQRGLYKVAKRRLFILQVILLLKFASERL